MQLAGHERVLARHPVDDVLHRPTPRIDAIGLDPALHVEHEIPVRHWHASVSRVRHFHGGPSRTARAASHGSMNRTAGQSLAVAPFHLARSAFAWCAMWSPMKLAMK